MDKQQAINIIKNTFEKPFNKDRFSLFIKNLLNKIDESKTFHARGDVTESYSHVVKTYERIGTYNSPSEEKIDIIIVYLQNRFSLDYARVTQRNFAGKYLSDRGQKDAGLFSFVSPDGDDWRFSLVKMDYKFEETKTGKMKVKEEFTPARRWSFLVGASEKSHTAQSRLVNILLNDEQMPTLAELEQAFDIETVTKEFFSKYRYLFIRIKEALDKVVKNDSKIKADFEAKSVNTVDFSKKLLGQIVFLYFLQKKGWFGVNRDACWGTGSKHFLRELFDKKHGLYENFFNDVLEHLFYDALRDNRDYNDYYYGRLNCKIPFLNGGLFDPIGNYDWLHTDICLPDSLFSNTIKTEEGDIGNGILDIFDRYNFTVKEDEPLEKEVAIDPELLGKAYEKFNAIRTDNFEEYRKALNSSIRGEENKFNKQYGVYYTPREIVHYMCQQSLINYLVIEMAGKVNQKTIEFLILEGEKYIEYLKTAKQKNEKNANYKGDYKENLYFIELKKYAIEIDVAISNIKVCDPAVGSGAFPIGMMSEIVKARMFFFETDCLEKTYINSHGVNLERNFYNFKRECIEKTLYGVDIDPGAVEIAKLRLWLSLIVDEEDIENIRPLPNLDYKIVCGNSLFNYPHKPIGLVEIEKIKEQFFKEVNPIRKNELRNKIDDAIYGLFKNTEKNLGYKVTMDFKINFSEVFHEKDGFDVVIGNPPYGAELSKNEKEILDKKFYRCKSSTKNSAIYFIYISDTIIKRYGVNSFIVPKSLCYSLGWNKCACFILLSLKKLIDTGKAFEQVKLEQIIFVRQNNSNVSFFTNGLYNGKSVVEFANVETAIFSKYKVLLAGQTPEEIKLIKKITFKFNKTISEYIEIKRGLNWQSKVKKYEGKIPIYRGAQLSPYFIDKAIDFINPDKFYNEEYSYQLKPKILNQLAIAHVQNPYPHFYLQAALDLDNRLVFETISCTFIKDSKINIKFILGINNSKLFAWILYKFIYSNAIRSTRYDELYVGRIPCPDFEKIKQNPITDFVDKILSITQSDDYINNQTKQSQVREYENQIDQMVYDIYGLTEEEIKIVEGNIADIQS